MAEYRQAYDASTRLTKEGFTKVVSAGLSLLHESRAWTNCVKSLKVATLSQIPGTLRRMSSRRSWLISKVKFHFLRVSSLSRMVAIWLTDNDIGLV
eukprot:CAMPEP_0197248556 /NCGR_PEP_ID=MMETSP1429-20130617/40342_1 /TAXON_ID=49237 /ORGANISM="Chaetoceros  sp., Strain UNC1202" /LENGTH=95 /DNA_ID=CAMNT_0042709815 /DNA_START=599 /DNA_END=883 /DNA_ORIENTATION=+